MLRFIRERILPKVGPWSIAGFVVICLAVTAVIIGLRKFKNYVVSFPEFNVKSIIIAKPPAWAPQTLLVAKIREAFPEDANIFDRDLPNKVFVLVLISLCLPMILAGRVFLV